MGDEIYRAERDLARQDFEGARRNIMHEIGEHPWRAQRIVNAINQDECMPGHSGMQVDLVTRNGYLDVAFRAGDPYCRQQAFGEDPRYEQPPVVVVPVQPGIVLRPGFHLDIRIPFGHRDHDHDRDR